MATLRSRWWGHVCLAVLHDGTVEHALALRRQAQAAGLSVCFLTFDLWSGAVELAPPVTRVTDAAALRAHVSHWESRALFLQSPYPEQYPEWFFESTVDIVLAYAGYGLTLSTWTHGHFATDAIRATSYLLAAGPYSYDGYIGHNPQATVLLTGNPLLYQLRQQLRRPRRAGRPATVLWAPHWTKQLWDGTRGFSRWQESVAAILDWTRSNPAARLVFRPHPIFQLALQAYLGTGQTASHREAAKSIDIATDGPALESVRLLLELSNVEVSTGGLLDDVLRCDALVTDGISIIAYWSATGKPMLVVRDAQSPEFNADGTALVAAADVAADGRQVRDWLRAWAAGTVPPSPERVDLSRTVHPTFDESPVRLWQRALPPVPLAERVRRTLGRPA
jgi:hypothetical protein